MRISEIEALRGLMALWVVVTHILTASGIVLENLPKPLSLLFGHGYAVDVFLLVSGFVIFLLLDKKREDYLTFVIRRGFRILPAYIVCLLLSVTMVDLSIWALQQLPWPHPHNAIRLEIFENSKAYFWPQLLAHLPLLQGLFDPLLPSSSYAFIGQAWSLSRLWQFYLVAPFIFAAIFSPRRWVTYSVIGLILLSPKLVYVGPGFITADFYYFLIGMLSYFAWKHRDQLPLTAATAHVAAPLVTATVALASRDVPLTIWTFCFVCFLVNARFRRPGSVEDLIGRLFGSRPFLALGSISYSVYLVHMLVVYGCMAVLVRFELAQMTFLLLMMVMVIPLTLIAATMLNRWVELPVSDWGRRLTDTLQSRRLARQGLAASHSSS